MLALRKSAQGRHVELRASFDDVVDALRDSNADDEHDPEGRTIAVDRSMFAGLAQDAAAQVDAIDSALARLDAGTCGSCESCRQPIDEGRLEARPTATNCIACATVAMRG